VNVDAVKLTPLQRAEYMKKGLCFICGKQGHHSTDHNSVSPPSSKPTPIRAVKVPPTPTPTQSAADAYFSELRNQNIPKSEVLDVLRTCFEDKDPSDDNSVSISKVELYDQSF
ncbi:hypothetical protein PAXRUDRAFT_167092, partial [Paxillus rubicundulus Ve08.2h10]